MGKTVNMVPEKRQEGTGTIKEMKERLINMGTDGWIKTCFKDNNVWVVAYWSNCLSLQHYTFEARCCSWPHLQDEESFNSQLIQVRKRTGSPSSIFYSYWTGAAGLGLGLRSVWDSAILHIFKRLCCSNQIIDVGKKQCIWYSLADIYT